MTMPFARAAFSASNTLLSTDSFGRPRLTDITATSIGSGLRCWRVMQK